MVSLSVAGAWLAAKALAAKAAVGRFFNGAALGAVAIVTVGVVVLIGSVMLWHAVRSGAAAEAVAGWQSKLATSRMIATLRERRLAREADAAAAAERQVLIEQIRATAEHSAGLEQQLARREQNPVCFPAPIAKELRK